MKQLLGKYVLHGAVLIFTLALLSGCGSNDEQARLRANERLALFFLKAEKVEVDGETRTVTYHNVTSDKLPELRIATVVERGLTEPAYAGETPAESVSMEALELRGLELKDVPESHSTGIFTVAELDIKQPHYTTKAVQDMPAMMERGIEGDMQGAMALWLQCGVDSISLKGVRSSSGSSGPSFTLEAAELVKPSLMGVDTFTMTNFDLQSSGTAQFRSLLVEGLRLPSCLTEILKRQESYSANFDMQGALTQALLDDLIKALSPVGLKRAQITGLVLEGESYPSLDSVFMETFWSDDNSKVNWRMHVQDLPVNKKLLAEWEPDDLVQRASTLTGVMGITMSMERGVVNYVLTLDLDGGAIGAIKSSGDYSASLALAILGDGGPNSVAFNSSDLVVVDKGLVHLLCSMVGAQMEISGPVILQQLISFANMAETMPSMAGMKDIIGPVRDTIAKGGELRILLQPKAPLTPDALMQKLESGVRNDTLGLSVTRKD